MEFIIRADDFGFSEAVNRGVMKAYQGGLIKNIGLMSNMPYAQQAFELIKGEDIALGLHVNLVVGKPCADIARIPSLVAEDGHFQSSKRRRMQQQEGVDAFVYEECVLEVKAQVERFLQICGKLPDYMDAHAVCTFTSERAICDVGDSYGIHIQGHVADARWTLLQTDFTNEDFYRQKRPYVEFFTKHVSYGDKRNLVVFHPGYLDMDVYRQSSLTWNRCRDVELLCDEAVKQFFTAHTLVSFKELG